MIEIEGPDGTIYEFPEGTDEGTMRTAMQKVYGAPQSTPEAVAVPDDVRARWAAAKNGTLTASPESLAQHAAANGMTGQGFGNNLAQMAGDGLLAGFGDEVSARLNALTGYDARSGTYGNDTTYADQLAAVRGQEEQFRADHPVTATVAEIGGALIPAATGVGMAARGGTLGAQALRGAGAGAAMGGLYGFGEGEGGIQDRMTDGLIGAAAGGVLGGALPAVGNLAGRGVRAAQDWARDSSIGRNVADRMGVSRAAGSLVSDLVGMSNPQALQQSLARAGDDAMLADGSTTLARALDLVTQSPGDGAALALQRIDDRAARSSDAIVDALLGGKQGPRIPPATLQNRMADSARGKINPLYREAYESAIDYASPEGRAIEELIKRIPPARMNAAIRSAQDRMTYDGHPLAQVLAQIGDNGSVEVSQLPNVMQLDYIKRAFDAVADDSKDAITGRMTSDGAFASQIARDIRKATKQAVPAYGDALEAAANDIRQRGAVRTGQGLLSARTTVEDALGEIGNATGAERRAMREGVLGQIEHTLGNVRAVATDPDIDARQALTAFKELSSPNAQRKMEALFGDEWPGVQQAMSEATAALGLRARTGGNSMTAGRQIFDELFNDATEPGAVRKGEIMGSARSVWQRLTGASPENVQRVRAGIREEVADLLTQPRGQDLLANILAARSGAQINPALSGQANRALVTALMASVPQFSQGLQTVLGR